MLGTLDEVRRASARTCIQMINEARNTENTLFLNGRPLSKMTSWHITTYVVFSTIDDIIIDPIDIVVVQMGEMMVDCRRFTIAKLTTTTNLPTFVCVCERHRMKEMRKRHGSVSKCNNQVNWYKWVRLRCICILIWVWVSKSISLKERYYGKNSHMYDKTVSCSQAIHLPLCQFAACMWIRRMVECRVAGLVTHSFLFFFLPGTTTVTCATRKRTIFREFNSIQFSISTRVWLYMRQIIIMYWFS